MFFLRNFQHLGGSNTTDVNRTMDIRWVLGAVTDGARDLCKSSRYCEILTKMRETSPIIIHKSCLILYFPWNIWVLIWLSADLHCLGIIPTRSVGSFLWEACLFQPWRNRHGQSSTAQQFRRLCSQRSSWKLRLRRFKSLEVKDPREPISEPWWDDDTTLVAIFFGGGFFFSERFQVGDSLKMYMNPSSQEVESSKGCWAVLHQLQVFLQICYSDLQLTIPFFWWLPNISMI